MNKLLAPIAALLIAFVFGFCLLGIFHAGRADAQVPTPAIAEPGSVTSTPVEKPSDKLSDPTTAPADYMSDLAIAKKTGWPLAILVGLWGLCNVLAKAGKSIKALAFLGTGKVAFVIGATAATVTALIDAIGLGGSYTSAIMVGLISLFGFLNIGAKSPSSSPASSP